MPTFRKIFEINFTRRFCAMLLLCGVLLPCLFYAAPAFAQTSIELPDPHAANTRIGSVSGSACEEYALENYPEAHYYGYENPIDALSALSADALDYVVTTELDAGNYIRKHGGVRIYQNDLLPSESSIGVSKENPELTPQINEVLTRFLADGTIERMEKNWIHPDGAPYVMDEVPELSDAPLLRVAISAGFEPMAFLMNDELAGFDVELIKRIAYELGYRVQFLETEFTSVLLALESGQADVAISGLYANEQRSQVADFTQIYYYDTLVLASRDASAVKAPGVLGTPASSFRNYFIVEQRWKLICSGIGVTLLISVFSGILGFAFGVLFCSLRMRKLKPVSAAAAGLIRVVQGTPLVLILMLLYYVVFPRRTLNGVLTAILAFSLSSGVNVSEILRNGIEAVAPEQWEAGSALGLDKLQTFRSVILPQAAKHFMPLIIDEYASLIKTTSIVGYVAVQDLTKVSDMIRSRSYEAFFPIVFSALIYFLLSFTLTMPLRSLGRLIDPDPRPRTIKGVKLS